MGRKARKKRGAAKTVPTAAPLVDTTVFGGSYSLQVPQGWMLPAEVLATGLDARPSEQFVSRRALSGPSFASLMVDVVPAQIRDLGSPSGKQRLCEFVNYHEEENDATFKAPVEIEHLWSPFESGWLIEYKSVGKLEGRTTRTMAALLESPEADVILRLNNGDTENVCFPSIVGSLRRVPGAPPPQPHYPGGSGLPVPQTIELDYDELEAVAKDRDVDVDFLWMAAQAMCFSPAEMASMDAATAEKVDNLRERPEFERYLHAALDVPAVRRRFEEVQWARASSEQASYKAASEPVDDPRARAISVAVAVAKAAAKAVPPHENITENARWIRAIQTLRDAITTDDSDEDNFHEYMQSRKYDGPEKYWPHEKMLKCMTRWQRLRKYWPRLRRRICTYCGTFTLDLSRPRFLVCGGCAKGRGVGRYCSENCQRADWPRHQEACPLIHSMPVEAHPWLRKMEHEVLFAGIEVIEAESPGLSPEEISEQIQNRILPNLEDSSGSQFLRTL